MSATPAAQRNAVLDWAERTGNRLPDPAAHFLVALFLTLALSALLARWNTGEIDLRTGETLVIHNQFTPLALSRFLAAITTNPMGFPPLGVVLVLAILAGASARRPADPLSHLEVIADTLPHPRRPPT